MLEEKNKIIKAIKNLDTRNIWDIANSDEFDKLWIYYITNNLDPIMALYDLMDIEDIYLEGDLTSITKNIYGYEIIVYNNITNDPMHSNLPYALAKSIVVPDKTILKGIHPEDGIRVYIDLDSRLYKAYSHVHNLAFIATKIEKLDRKVFPIKICPKCKYISNDRSDTASDYCAYCSTDNNIVPLIVTVNAKEARELIRTNNTIIL